MGRPRNINYPVKGEYIKSSSGQLREDLEGIKLNGWTINKYLNSGCMYLCTCENGHVANKKVQALKEGRISPCVLCKAQDLVGKSIGRWTVLDTITEMGKNGRYKALWVCKCMCGEIHNLHFHQLYNKRSYKECRKSMNNTSEGNFNIVLATYKDNAKKRNIYWGLSKEEFKSLTQMDCFYTGLPPSTISKTNGSRPFVYNGVDRLDSSKGYTIEKCVPCNSRVNIMKMAIPYQEFVDICTLIAKTMANKNTEELGRDNNLRAV